MPARGCHGNNVIRYHRSQAAAATIKQHYYPEGGWGWVVCGCACIVHAAVTGLQVTHGLMLLQMLATWGRQNFIMAVSVVAMHVVGGSVSRPVVSSRWRHHCARLVAVLAALAVCLACLFASFAQQLHQVLLSYGVVLGVAAGLLRSSSSVVVGDYFRRRRQLAEGLVQAGGGVGVLCAAICLGWIMPRVGWRVSLQWMAVAMLVPVLSSFCYRPASLYHPQRRAILHLKHQQRKIKEKKDNKTKLRRVEEEDVLIDWQVLKSRTVQMFAITSLLSAAGTHAPLLLLALQYMSDCGDSLGLVYVYATLGLSAVLGTCVSTAISAPSRGHCWKLPRRYVVQLGLVCMSVGCVLLCISRRHVDYVCFSVLFGVGTACYQHSFTMLVVGRIGSGSWHRVDPPLQLASALGSLLGIATAGCLWSWQVDSCSWWAFSAVSLTTAALSLFSSWLRRSCSRSVPSCSCSTDAGRPQPHLTTARNLSATRTPRQCGLLTSSRSISLPECLNHSL